MTEQRSRRFLRAQVLLLVSLALGGISTAPVRAETGEKVSRLLERGREMIARGDLGRARDSFERAERKHEGNCAECALGLSHVARRLGEIGTAIAEARRATRMAANQVERYYASNQLALSLYTSARLQLSLNEEIEAPERRRARLEEAVAAYDEAMRNAGPLAPSVRCSRAEVLYRLERFEEAQADLKTCIGAETAEELEPLRAHLEAILEQGLESDLQINQDSRPVRLGANFRPPVKISTVPPVYNEIARQARVMGVVILQSMIYKNGQVGPITVLQSQPLGLDWQAADAVRQWRFQPARLNGKPVAVFYNLIVNFKLQ